MSPIWRLRWQWVLSLLLLAAIAALYWVTSWR